MSDGTYCIVRDLGLVKGGKGMRHFECILRFTFGGVRSKLAEVFRRLATRADVLRAGAGPLSGVPVALERESADRRRLPR